MRVALRPGSMRSNSGMSRLIGVAILMASLLVATAAYAGVPPSVSAAERSDNVSVVRSFSFPNGNEIDAHGIHVYVGEWDSEARGGIHIFDVSKTKPREVGFVDCRAFPNDVEVLRPGLLAIGVDTGTCGRLGGAPGVQLVDVKDPADPRYLGAIEIPEGLHTISAHPEGTHVYVSPGSIGERSGTETIIDVSDPLEPRISGTYSFTPSGCHDVQFYVFKRRELGFCPGEGGTQIWDSSDPTMPRLITHIPVPALQLPHSVAVSSDGKLAAISQEDWALHECAPVGGPTGGLWIYDITKVEEPRLVGYYKTPRARRPVGTIPPIHSCTAHNNMFVPGTKHLLSAWYAAGTTVVDLEDPSRPTEIAYFHPSDASALAAYWHRGRVFVSDMNRGLDVLKVSLP